MKMHKDGGAEAPPILVHLRSYDPHTRGGLRPPIAGEEYRTTLASFARFAVVAGAFVRSGTRVGWSPRCVVAGEEYRTTLRELRSLRCGRWCLRTVWYKSWLVAALCGRW